MTKNSTNTQMDLDKLVSCTKRYMVENKLSDINLNNSGSSRQKESTWGQLCKKVFGSFDMYRALQIRTWWSRNTKNYKTAVLEDKTKEISK